MSLDDHKYTLLRQTADLIEKAISTVCPRFQTPLPICFKTQQGAKKLRIGIAWSVETEIPCKDELTSIIAAANAEVKGELAAIGKITLNGFNDKRVSTKEKDVKCLELLINITGTMPTGPAASKAKRGTTIASKAIEHITAEQMPVLQGDSIPSALDCVLFEIKRTLAETSQHQASSSSSSSAPSTTNLEALLTERIKPVLLQFKNASYATGFTAAKKSTR